MATKQTIRSSGMRQFTIGMIAYGVIVLAMGFLVEPENLPMFSGVLLALLPTAAAVWAMAGWWRTIRSFDELQRKTFAEAGLISLGLTSAVTVTYGFLESWAGLPKLSMFFVFPFIAAIYTAALPIVRRRFFA